MMKLFLFALFILTNFATANKTLAHQEPSQGGLCHFYEKKRLHCHYLYETEELLLEENPDLIFTEEPEETEVLTQEEEEKSVKDPLEEKRKAAGRVCLDTLKKSCGELSLGASCHWTARFSCEQKLKDAIATAENHEFSSYIQQDKQPWDEEIIIPFDEEFYEEFYEKLYEEWREKYGDDY